MGMSPFKLLVSHEEAERILLENCKPVDRKEEVELSVAAGRVLAEDIMATENVPPFARAAMDGYAVIAKDTFGADETEVVLKIVDQVFAGELTEKVITSGECIQIATGAPLPPGADAVVMVEFTERCGESRIRVMKPIYPGGNVSKAGEDIKAGEIVLTKGTYLTPARIGVAAALGKSKLNVYAKPEVAVIPTGREIAQPGEPLPPGKIYDVNSFTLEAILTANGASVNRFPVVPDEYDALTSAISSALNADVVVLSGGSSVGEKDLMVDVLEELGEILFHGVQIKPGKPTLFAIVQGKPVVGMPGYPTSCLSNAYIFLVPAIRKVARLPPKHARTVTAKLAKRVVSSSGRKQFLTVRIENGMAYPVYRHSGAITSMSRADGYVMLPVNLDVIEEGDEVEITLFD